MRPVDYKKSFDGEMCYHGLFCGFFACTEEGNENFGNYTVAFIEQEDGTIFEAPSSWIKFTDKP